MKKNFIGLIWGETSYSISSILLNSARTLVTLALVGYELHEDFSKHIGKLVCRHGAKPCNKET